MTKHSLRERLLSSASCCFYCEVAQVVSESQLFPITEGELWPFENGIYWGPDEGEFGVNWDAEIPFMGGHNWWEPNNLNKQFTDHLRGSVTVELMGWVVKW